MTKVKLDVFEKRVADFVHQVANGETVVLLGKGNKPLAELKPVKKLPSNGNKRPFGLCKGEFVVPKSFDEPLPKEFLKAFGVR